MERLLHIGILALPFVCMLSAFGGDIEAEDQSDKPSITFSEKIRWCDNLGCSCTKLEPTPKPTLILSGYVNAQQCFDTRQVYSSRDGEGLEYPFKKDIVACGVDANKQGSFSMYLFNVLLAFYACGKPVWGTKKTYAIISTDFRGMDATTIELLRMRDAYVVFDWERTQLLTGQKLHPFFIDDCYPNTVAGGPLEVFTNIPMVRLTQKLNGAYKKPSDNLIFTLGTQCPATMSKSPTSDAPGTSFVRSTLVGRNGVMPILQVQWRHYFGTDNFFGIMIEGQRLRPRLKTAASIPYAEKCSAFTECMCGMYAKIVSDCAILKTKASFIQDGSELGFMGGYAVEDQASFSKRQKYTPLRSISFWFDVDFWPDQELSPGFIVAFSKNLGAGKLLFLDANKQPTIYCYGPGGSAASIDTFFKVSPRLWFSKGVINIGAEIDWTRAGYGTIDEYGAVQNAVPVNNVRFQLSIFYKF
ncbi:TPA: hypothetical protein DDZ86_01300 [Candidatus Dependentiae bacterium]|nr:MAG: hypothetical protein UW09_C0004G0141 [candidate division TM6 bacterium GW2011_GWF2_43_87]HBL98262.1 hypothetical protein [Candidatus Dependentiae bacterium]